MHPKEKIDLENVELKAFWSLRGVKASTNHYKSWEMAAWSSCVRSSFRLLMKSLLRNRLKIWHIRSWWRTHSSPSCRRRTPSHIRYDCSASPERFLICTPPCVKVFSALRSFWAVSWSTNNAACAAYLRFNALSILKWALDWLDPGI